MTVAGAPDSSFTNYAFDIDAQWGKPGDEGLFVLAEYLNGNDASAAKFRMQGIPGLAAYNIRMKSPTSWLYAVEPAFRVRPGRPEHRPRGRSRHHHHRPCSACTCRAGRRSGWRTSGRASRAMCCQSISGMRSALTVNF